MQSHDAGRRLFTLQLDNIFLLFPVFDLLTLFLQLLLLVRAEVIYNLTFAFVPLSEPHLLKTTIV